MINFDPIHTVKCTGQNIHIEFANHHGAQTALKSWAAVPRLAMIAAPQHGCGGTDLKFMEVKALKLEGKVMKAIQANLPPEEIIQDYKLELVQDAPRPKPRLRKRNGGGSDTSIGLNLNHDGTSVQQPSFVLDNSREFLAACTDCFAIGSAKFRTTAAGSIDGVHSLKFSLEGELTANLGLKLKMNGALIRQIASLDMFKLSMLPVHISGLFEIGPSIIVSAALSVQAAVGTATELNMGSVIKYPFNFTVDTPNRAVCRPQFNYDFKGIPEIQVKPVTLTGGSVTLKLLIGPRLGIGFKIFNQGLDVALVLGSELGLQAKAPGCEGVPVDPIFYREDLFRAEYTMCGITVAKDIWNAHRVYLPCDFCNKCQNKDTQKPDLIATGGSLSKIK